MKKILFAFLVSSVSLAHAQTVSVSGTVTDQQGKPVPFAFVVDSQHPYATYSDQNGSFSLKADPASNLFVSAAFHSEVKVKINDPANVKVLLPLDSGSTGPSKAERESNFFKPEESRIDHVQSINHIGTGSDQGLHGSRYLFENWVHGFAISPKDSIKQDGSYLFNYDKITGSLMFTRTRKTAMLVDKNEIKGFTLFDENVIPFTFVEVPAIDSKRYVQVLAQGPKYKVYRTLTTKFVKADFTTNGFTSSGHNYDEYKDESTYYCVIGTGQPQKFELRSKAIKAVFAGEPEKVKKYLSDNEGDIDDNYIKALGEYMNQ